MNKKFITTSLLISTLMVSACAGGTTQQAQRPVSSMQPQLKSASIDRAMESALAQAQAAGNKQEVLALLGQVHKRSPKDPIVATRYAVALRDDEQINAAIRTLKPFTGKENANIEATTEMAMAQLALGDYDAAASYSDKAIKMDTQNARAYLALGTAQDAQGNHEDAEVSFRQGVKFWKGDPSPILNNLALNLASQGHLEEALSLIKKAQQASPGRVELERNRRIISTLLETTTPMPPAPDQKPSAEKPKEESKKTAKKKAPIPPKKKVAVKQEPKKAPKQEPKEKVAEEKIEVKEEPKKQEQRQAEPKSTVNIKLKPLS